MFGSSTEDKNEIKILKQQLRGERALLDQTNSSLDRAYKRNEEMRERMRVIMTRNKLLPLKVVKVPEFCKVTAHWTFPGRHITKQVEVLGYTINRHGEPVKKQLEGEDVLELIRKEHNFEVIDCETYTYDLDFRGEKIFVKTSMEKGDIKEIRLYNGVKQTVETSVISEWQEIK